MEIYYENVAYVNMGVLGPGFWVIVRKLSVLASCDTYILSP